MIFRSKKMIAQYFTNMVCVYTSTGIYIYLSNYIYIYIYISFNLDTGLMNIVIVY